MKTSLIKLWVILPLFLVLFLCVSITSSKAQMGMQLLDDNGVSLITEYPDDFTPSLGIQHDDEKRMQSFFVELGGPGLIVTFNYDTRFTQHRDGIGIRLGFGGFAVEGEGFLTVPVQINYLLGKGIHFFEIGLGATIFTGSVDFFGNGVSSTTVFGTMTFGYRYQPEDSGFTFRAGINPIFGNFENGFTFFPYLPSVSFGYAF